MSAGKMHADEFDIDTELVRRLLAAQLPHWADLPLAPIPSAGTDNAMLRLGDAMTVRLPRIPSAAEQVEKEQRWLPHIAPHLPLAVPQPLALGHPGEGYPWRWSVYSWLEGENATRERIADQPRTARDVARFIVALRSLDATGGPPPGTHNFFRGVPLAQRDEGTRSAIAALDALGMIDAAAATAAWEAALRAPAWDRPPVWIHGDLQAGNLLAVDGSIRAVIDFGSLGVGDPACDMLVAWNLFDAEARAAFRAAVEIDEATWARGKGWALSTGLIALPYYHRTNPVLADIGRYAIQQALGDTG